jgi:hypothetical protein
MIGLQALWEILAGEGKVEWDASGNPHLLASPETHPLIYAHRDTIREVLRRARLLRAQALQFIPKQIPMPVLALPDCPGVTGCLSCGAAVTTGQYRCALCAVAVELAIADFHYQFTPWTWQPEPGDL